MNPEDDFDDDGEDAFLAQINPDAAAEERATKAPPVEETEVEAPEGEEEVVEAPSEPGEADEEDDREFDVKHGETSSKVKLKDLRALYAEREAITARNAEVAQARTTAAATAERADVALRTMLQRAEAAFEPYSKLNFLALAKNPNVSAETIEQLQTDAQAAYTNVQYLKTELDANMKAAQSNSEAALREAANACAAVLRDPKTGIEGFGKEVWNDIHGYAVKTGIPAATVDRLTDPAAIKIIHKAMLFDRQAEAAKVAQAKVKVAQATPKRTMKANTASTKSEGPPAKNDAMRALRKSGSIDDAVDAFQASFG